MSFKIPIQIKKIYKEGSVQTWMLNDKNEWERVDISLDGK